MFNYVFKRIGFALLALFILITLIFFLGQLIPGFPFDLTNQDTPESIQSKLEQYGLNDNLIIQYFRFWTNLFTTGKFGQSYRSSEPIHETFFKVMPYTISISSIAFILGSFLGITFGIIAAVYRGKWQDTVINIFSVFFISVPSFVLATFFIRIASNNHWPIWFPSIGSEGFEVKKLLQASILPISALTISMAPPLVYYTRNEMVDVLNQDYIKTALSKGNSYASVIFKHGLRNCLIPIISVCLPMFLIVVGGSIIIERFFGVPGIADQLVSAVQKKEVFLLMFNALIITGIYYFLSIVCDVLYTVIDPRIKLAENNSISLFKKISSSFNRNSMFNKYKKVVEKTIYEIEYGSDLEKIIREKHLINLSKKIIYLNQQIIQDFSLDVSKKYLFYLGNKYKVKIKEGGDVN